MLLCASIVLGLYRVSVCRRVERCFQSLRKCMVLRLCVCVTYWPEPELYEVQTFLIGLRRVCRNIVCVRGFYCLEQGLLLCQMPKCSQTIRLENCQFKVYTCDVESLNRKEGYLYSVRVVKYIFKKIYTKEKIIVFSFF